MEITEQQFNANLQNLSEIDQQNVISVIQEIGSEELRSFAKVLGVDIIISEELVDESIETSLDETPVEETPVEETPVEETPVEETPVEEETPIQSPIEQQMQQLAVGDQVVAPAPTEDVPIEDVLAEVLPVDAVAGPIMQEGASETGVADDVPMDAEEGAYVVNAAAIERVGVRDFEERILKPNIESLRKKGVEINLEQLKSPAAQVEGDTDIAVSNGEYYLPPILVKEIGLDLLEKINKRGQKETEERIAEEEAPVEPMQQQVQALNKGNQVKKKIRPSQDQIIKNQNNVRRKLKNLGYRKEAIAGIMGNIYGENDTFDYRRIEDKKGKNKGYGLFQFTGGRKKAYENYLREMKKSDSIDSQLEYMTDTINITSDKEAVNFPKWETFDLGLSNRKSLRNIFKTGNVKQITNRFLEIFENPTNPNASRQKRINFANKIYNAAVVAPLPKEKPKPAVVAPLPKEKPPTRGQQARMRPGLDKVQNTMDTREIQQFPERVMQ